MDLFSRLNALEAEMGSVSRLTERVEALEAEVAELRKLVAKPAPKPKPKAD